MDISASYDCNDGRSVIIIDSCGRAVESSDQLVGGGEEQQELCFGAGWPPPRALFAQVFRGSYVVGDKTVERDFKVHCQRAQERGEYNTALVDATTSV